MSTKSPPTKPPKKIMTKLIPHKGQQKYSVPPVLSKPKPLTPRKKRGFPASTLFPKGHAGAGNNPHAAAAHAPKPYLITPSKQVPNIGNIDPDIVASVTQAVLRPIKTPGYTQAMTDETVKARQLVNVGGKMLSSETAFEALKEMALDNIDDIDAFAEFVTEFVRHEGDLSKLTTRTHQPVGLDTFLDDPYFLNLKGSVYPVLRHALHEIIDGGYVEALFMGAIGVGKSTGAQIIQAYHLYLLSCEKFPQAKYGLMPTSSITMAMLNRSDALANTVTYGEFRSLVEVVPYFNEMYPFIKDKKSTMEFPRGNIRVMASAAYNNKLLGMNIIGGIIDELNFFQVVDKSKQSRDGGEFNQAKVIYNSLIRRRKSRFLQEGKLPGCICAVSSKGGPDDFTELRAKEAMEEDGNTTYIWDKAQWEVVPASRFSGKKFFVEVGTERTNSRIVESRDVASPGADVIDVPIEFFDEFKRDMEGSLRDYAGRSTLSKRPFFYDRDKIWNCATLWDKSGYMTPFGNLQRLVLTEDTLPEVVKNYKVPNPQAARVAHIDLGLTGDACGFAVGHVSRIVTQRTRGLSGVVLEDLPEVTIDVALQVVPPRGGELEISLVRQLLYLLRDAGVPIQLVTLDQFQSSDTQQILRRKGFRSEHLSVDGTLSEEAYKGLRSGMFNDRVLCAENATGFKELASLEKTTKGYIDHPSNSCFTGDTLVRLADGSSIRFDELAEQEGKEVITWDGKNAISALAINPRLTKYTSELVEIELDNGELIRCTPEHRFLLTSGVYKEAQHLTVDDDLQVDA